MEKAGQRIKHVRKILKLSQVQLADKLGVIQSKVGKAETKGNKIGQIEIMLDLHRYFNVSLEWLFFQKGEIFVDGKIPEGVAIDLVEEPSNSYADKDMVIRAQREQIKTLQDLNELLKMQNEELREKLK